MRRKVSTGQTVGAIVVNIILALVFVRYFFGVSWGRAILSDVILFFITMVSGLLAAGAVVVFQESKSL